MNLIKKYLNRVFIDGLSGMALGLFATLIIGTIIQQIGTLAGGSIGALIYAVGNAPTALIRLYELIRQGTFRPELIIGVPVGFVNVVQSKELIMQTDVPYIVAKGRKGGSNVAAAICNALLYQLDGSRK